MVVAEKGCLAGALYLHTPLPSLAARGDSRSDPSRIRAQLPRGSDAMPGQRIVQGIEVNLFGQFGYPQHVSRILNQALIRIRHATRV